MTAALTTGTNSWNQLQSAFPAAGVTQTVAGLTIAIGPLTTDVGATITDVPTAEPRIIARSAKRRRCARVFAWNSPPLGE